MTFNTYAVLALTAAFVLPTAAEAQSIFGRKILETARAKEAQASRVTSVFSDARPELDPQGVNAGAFNVQAGVEVATVFDDNIFASEDNEESDVIIRIRPEISAASTWSRHELTAVAYLEDNQFLDNSDEEFTDFGGQISGRLDVATNSYATAGIGYEQKHEDRDDPSTSTVADEPTEFDDFNANIGYTHAVGKAYATGRVNYRELDFDDGTSTAGANINNDDRDREHLDYIAEVGYAPTPNSRAFVRGTYTDVEYDENEAGLVRDSDGFEIAVGAASDITSNINAEGYVSYLNRDFDDVSFDEIDTVGFGGSVLWRATRLTSIEGKLDRRIRETTVTGASSVLQTGFNAELQHELTRSVRLKANAGYIFSEFEDTNREDDNYRVGVGAEYAVNRHLSAGADYQFRTRNSNNPGSDFDRNIFLLSLKGDL